MYCESNLLEVNKSSLQRRGVIFFNTQIHISFSDLLQWEKYIVFLLVIYSPSSTNITLQAHPHFFNYVSYRFQEKPVITVEDLTTGILTKCGMASVA